MFTTDFICCTVYFDRFLKGLRSRWPTDVHKILFSIERKSVLNLWVGHWNMTTDRLHNLRNAERIPLLLYFYKFIPFELGKSKNIMFIFIGIVTWHCGDIPLHPVWPFAKFVHMSILNLQKDISQFTIFTKVLTCFIEHALNKMRIVDAKDWHCVYIQIFKREDPLFGEREKRKRLYFLKLICFWSAFNFNHPKNNICWAYI